MSPARELPALFFCAQCRRETHGVLMFLPLTGDESAAIHCEHCRKRLVEIRARLAGLEGRLVALLFISEEP
jgi:DNA-directed RNA polymerase subunit RPC12/RpoP